MSHFFACALPLSGKWFLTILWQDDPAITGQGGRMDKEQATDRLFRACAVGALAAVRQAIDAGADVNARDLEQDTPLHWAAATGNLNIAVLLIERGAKVSAEDNQGRSPKSFAQEYSYTDIIDLLDAASSKQQQGHADRVTGDRKDKGPRNIGD
jgi:ankyrin repeat protein